MLEIQKFTVKKQEKELLKNINLSVSKNEGIVVFGPNGGGKSTFFKSIMGVGDFQVSGKVTFNKKNILNLDIEKKVQLGINYMYQTAPLVKGVELSNLLALMKEFKGSLEELYEEMREPLKSLDMEYLFDREINVGLSGGEVKRSELLTLSLLKDSKMYLLDEPDSGVDIENVKRLGNFINTMVKGKSYMIVTHSGEILKYLNPDRGIVMINGELVFEGDVNEILNEVRRNGYSNFSKKEL